ncbi:conserved hypothetical protein [Histoplasma capsulatum G186AR]|uniref:TAM domain methyltransferase n=2 Tax=Ajellomyces capsulatus TaxID=5037 RepID=C0NU21_AJECG|nr:uncharacterized protein HCBG_06852 [Histoplasma capsulatum G186AR]EEH04901.1 conserved hypothetical protein [Histoplasma capsulatum G186AR]KAG5287556.1 TAM domain methyltransferase [Histoplasma capsulatum]QSS70630.1 TAM domain methyltransferase [Histoplasma capsulatum G186AR]
MFASMDEDETYSLTSSIRHYEYFGHRRYHAYHAGEYFMPNDEEEQERLDLMHHLFLLSYDGELYRAPIPKTVGRTLDIGCGTGIWAIDFADAHPAAKVIGSDLSAIQPGYIPENLQFEVDDAEEDWQYTQPFDFIHIRGMGGAIANWSRLLKQAYDNLAPGGWIELAEFDAWASTDDNSLPESSAYNQFQTLLGEASESFGKPVNVACKFKEFVQEAGFTNVGEDNRKIPLSPWSSDKKLKKLGNYMQMAMSESLEPYALALFSKVLNWDNIMIQALLAGARNDLKNMDYHMYTTVHRVFAQKPLS